MWPPPCNAGLYVPWAALWVGWSRGEVPPGCGCSGISHQGLFSGCSAACPPTRRGGCSATAGYTSACPAAVQGSVPGATETSASEGVEGRWESITQCQNTYCVFPRWSETGGRNPLKRHKIIPSICHRYIYIYSHNLGSLDLFFMVVGLVPAVIRPGIAININKTEHSHWARSVSSLSCAHFSAQSNVSLF